LKNLSVMTFTMRCVCSGMNHFRVTVNAENPSAVVAGNPSPFGFAPWL
jgi:hypothetical protein